MRRISLSSRNSPKADEGLTFACIHPPTALMALITVSESNPNANPINVTRADEVNSPGAISCRQRRKAKADWPANLIE